MATLLQYQDKYWMWHQFADDPNAWNETSCTGMLTFVLITGDLHGQALVLWCATALLCN